MDCMHKDVYELICGCILCPICNSIEIKQWLDICKKCQSPLQLKHAVICLLVVPMNGRSKIINVSNSISVKEIIKITLDNDMDSSDINFGNYRVHCSGHDLQLDACLNKYPLLETSVVRILGKLYGD